MPSRVFPMVNVGAGENICRPRYGAGREGRQMSVTTETPGVAPPPPVTCAPSVDDVARLITALQSAGLRVGVPVAARSGGAGPADAGMLYVEGVPTTVPTSAAYVAESPYVLRGEDDGGWAVYRDGLRLASASPAPRPRYYDLTTADGVPYWQIALLHLDSVASTVLQTCAYWGNADQCGFCGIGLTLAAGRTVAKKTPGMLAEVAVAARDLDGAVDATLTTGSTATPDRGAMYVARCAAAVKEAAGLPVQVQFEPPAHLDVIDRASAPPPPSTSSTGSPTWASTRWASTSRASTRPCWPGWPRARPAGASRRTSPRGSGRTPRSGRARCPPTSSSAWARTSTSPSRAASAPSTWASTPSSSRCGPCPAASWRTSARPPGRSSSPSTAGSFRT